MRAWIALGANLGDPPAQLRAALKHLQRAPRIACERSSSFFRSAPIGPAGQNDYCNAVCAVQTELAPLELLDVLQQIEDRVGRDRNVPRWGPRLIDLDLLLCDDVRLDTPRLTLPHPELHRRNFVLAPLAELEPNLMIPGHGRVSILLDAVGQEGLGSWMSGGDSHTA